MKIKATAIFGEMGIAYFNETGQIPGEEIVFEDGSLVYDKEFPSKELYDVYVSALEESDGTNGWKVVDYKEVPDKTTSGQSYSSRIDDLQKELTAEIVGYLKKLKHKFIVIPDEDEYEDVAYVMWVDDDGYAYDGRVVKMSLEKDDNFSVNVKDSNCNRTTLYSAGCDIGCNHVEWLESMLSMLEYLIDGGEWRLCHECGKAISEGFVVNRGDEYYCSKDCLHKHYAPEQWAEMCKGPEGYEDAGNDLNYHKTF